ncbi:SMR family transporter [Salinisphaera sp. Q1T1-3]|uniref:SMR family transporter n=1 Tax=Salinisphaera sp. Q1T1-3 TaxID=2321229 RepID=UPI000E742987|nr:SMR family transporter [Salinisphaera sp. Q1T1-3]RJS91431.1 QacE family quaternary ammonium compound efflux SMR transporter [Salinisphaera sp. Q1T1-3]
MPRRAPTTATRDRRVWPWLLPAGLTETGWVHGLTAARSAPAWGLTGLAIVASLYCALQAARVLPATTVYIVYMALGTLGTWLVSLAAGTNVPGGLATLWLAILAIGVAGLQHTDTGS